MSVWWNVVLRTHIEKTLSRKPRMVEFIRSGADDKITSRNLIATMERGKPSEFGLRCVQMHPVGGHPIGYIVDKLWEVAAKIDSLGQMAAKECSTISWISWQLTRSSRSVVWSWTRFIPGTGPCGAPNLAQFVFKRWPRLLHHACQLRRVWSCINQWTGNVTDKRPLYNLENIWINWPPVDTHVHLNSQVKLQLVE